MNKMPTGEMSRNGESRLQSHRKKKEKRQFTATRLCSPRLRRQLHREQLSGCVPFFATTLLTPAAKARILFSAQGVRSHSERSGRMLMPSTGAEWTHPVALLTANRRPWQSTADVRGLAPRPHGARSSGTSMGISVRRKSRIFTCSGRTLPPMGVW